MIEDYHLIEEMLKWTKSNAREGCLFLFAAATLSNYLIYELYKTFDKNQYIDIGSSLGYHLKLKGCYYRHYLNTYWNQGVCSMEVDEWK